MGSEKHTHRRNQMPIQPQHPLVTRGIYRIHSRNLSHGVYNGIDGFTGIREKFGSTYLFTEYLWEQGPPYGTVAIEPREHIADLMPHIPLGEYSTAVCITCRCVLNETPLITRDREHKCGCNCEHRTSMILMNQLLYDALLPFIPEEEKETWERSADYFTRRNKPRIQREREKP